MLHFKIRFCGWMKITQRTFANIILYGMGKRGVRASESEREFITVRLLSKMLNIIIVYSKCNLYFAGNFSTVY